VPVIRAEAVQEGLAVRAWADGTRVVVGRLPAAARATAGDADGECFAALDLCPHLDLPLAAFGPVPAKGERLVCPWHRWEFDVRTGRCEYASLYADDEIFFFQLEGKDQPEGEAAGRLHVLPARVRGGYVEVAL
jgi:nitrite reductase/ring-hydroxylating ferredoxin subunit